MRPRLNATFPTVRAEGALLPADLLQRIASGDGDLGGLKPADYGLPPDERLNEAISHSWKRMLGFWAGFSEARAKLPAGDPAVGLTRDRWLLPLFAELSYGRLSAARAVEIEGKSYPISHAWASDAGSVPIHLVGWGVDLDTRTPGVKGASSASPHSLLQELLNRSDDRQWGFLANGARLRVLRDSTRLTRQAYLEFDLEQMVTGQAYADFALLWTVCHASRVQGSPPWLERWSQAAQTQGTRALDQLRDGVQTAIAALGQGFLQHPHNGALREALRSGALDKQNFYRQLLRVVYRLLFLFVAEERELLLRSDAAASAAPEAADRYRRFYSFARLRALSGRRAGTRHVDLWRAARLVIDRLGRDEGCPELGLPGLGGFLFSSEATAHLNGCDIANQHLLDAVRALSYTHDGHSRRAVDYRHLGSEELGSVYESLLELNPQLDLAAGTFELAIAAGSERKTTGSYYTRSDLVDALLDSALEPVLAARLEAARAASGEWRAEDAILSLRVCDAACGSGHFLIAAAHRIARRLAAVRSGEDAPAPAAYQAALRDVISHCIYGVDINPMSVELCKVSLWMEAQQPDRPLSFLDHHIQCGNSLIGATPELIAAGVPDEAFTPIEGDDKKYCAEWKKANRKMQTAMGSLLTQDLRPWEHLGDLARAMAQLDDMSEDDAAAVARKAERYAEMVRASDYLNARLLADAWCAAFVWMKRPEPTSATSELRTENSKLPGFAYPITTQTLREIEHSPYSIPAWMREEIQRLAGQYQFFHWHLAFPEVFPPQFDSPSGEAAEAGSGFDVMLGNPPWERIKLQEKEWFAARSPEIAAARHAAERKRKIESLREHDPALHAAFLDDVRKAEGESQFVRASGRFPLTAVGDVNTYALFAELNRSLLGPASRAGVIVPTGIATDDTTKTFFGDIVASSSLVSLFDFENREGLFPAVDSRTKFSLLTLSHTPIAQAEFVFFATQIEHLRDARRRFSLTSDDIALVNPNTRTVPIFRTSADAELTRKIYERVPVLLRESDRDGNPWGIKFGTMFHMSNDSGLFCTAAELGQRGYTESDLGDLSDGQSRFLRLYEGRLGHQFNHRFASQPNGTLRELSSNELADPTCVIATQYYVSEIETNQRLGRRDAKCVTGLLGFRRIARNTDERTVIAAIIPWGAASYGWILTFGPTAAELCVLAGLYNSLTFDFLARNAIAQPSIPQGAMEQLATVPPGSISFETRYSIVRSVVELVYTAHDIEPFARDVREEVGAAQWQAWFGTSELRPFRWDPERRATLRAELDAYYARLYGLTRDELRYILDPQDVMGPDFPGETFRVLKERELRDYKEYRTRRLVLEAWDRLHKSV